MNVQVSPSMQRSDYIGDKATINNLYFILCESALRRMRGEGTRYLVFEKKK